MESGGKDESIEPKGAEQPLRRPLRVLIVDDNRDSLLTLSMLCRHEGMEVHMLRRGEEVPAAEIDKWIDDQGKPSREVFLRIVDLILDESRSGADSDSQEPPPPRDAAGSSRHYLD